jgi:hypothetical protein
VPQAPQVPPFELRGPESSEELDPELLALPDPPRRERTLTVTVLAIAAVLSLAMVFALRHDVTYALRGGGGTAADVGDLHAATEATLAGYENRYVRSEALLGAAGGIRYERPFVDDTFRTLPVAGRRDVWVDVRVPAGQETGRWEPPRSFVGRLVRFEGAGPRHRGLAGAIERASSTEVPAGAWLVIDGEAPDKARWTILLAAMFLGCAAWNLIAITRIVRKVH